VRRPRRHRRSWLTPTHSGPEVGSARRWSPGRAARSGRAAVLPAQAETRARPVWPSPVAVWTSLRMWQQRASSRRAIRHVVARDYGLGSPSGGQLSRAVDNRLVTPPLNVAESPTLLLLTPDGRSNGDHRPSGQGVPLILRPRLASPRRRGQAKSSSSGGGGGVTASVQSARRASQRVWLASVTRLQRSTA
jgi:hypothetical protein